MTEAHTARLLNTLVEACRDSRESWARAADETWDENEDFSVMFRQFADERQQMLEELQQQFDDRVENPSPESSLGGQIMSKLVSATAKLTPDTKTGALEAARRSEGRVLGTYEGVMDDQGLPAHLKPLVERQFMRVRNAQDRLTSMLRTERR